jgi:hypothetical protein
MGNGEWGMVAFLVIARHEAIFDFGYVLILDSINRKT